MKRTLTVALFALALIAGPVAAACGSCCPEDAAETALVPAQGCCGDCEPTVERSPDPASLTAKSTIESSDADAVLIAPADIAHSVKSASSLFAGATDRRFPPRLTLSPLRL